MVKSEFDHVSENYSNLPLQGDRALDRLTDEMIDGFSDSDYHLVLRQQNYPYLETNSEELGGKRHGIDQQGEFRLATIDIDDRIIEAYMTAIPEYEDERKQQLERAADAIAVFNDQADEEWVLRGNFFPENRVYNTPEHDYEPGVYTNQEAMEALQESDAFAELSSDFFGGWLEITGRTMLERR